MEQNTMGVMLFYYREKHKLSQEQVCEGICSVATLSRVEQGVREIDSLMSETLLGRIGKEVTLFEIMLDEEDYCRWKIRDEIVKEVERGDYERALKHIEQYRVLAVDASDIHEQFLQFYELKIIISRGEKKEKIGQLAKAILKLTMPKYGRIRERSVLYSPIEIQLVLIMIEYDGTGDIRQKEARLLELLAYIDEYYSDRKKEEESIEILRVLIAQKWKADDMKDILSYTD